MFRRSVSGLFYLSGFIGLIFISGNALAGPNHEAAMAIVEGGQSISDTGNLDAAMAEYERVEAEFPDEVEAIGMARFRISQCLVAGGRFQEAASVLTPVWSRIRSGEIESPDQRFWCGHQYAKCLSYGTDSWLLGQVAGDTYRVYEEMETPGPGMDQAAGWLRLWSARCFLKKEQYEWAKEAAEAAWEAGKAAKNGTLAAWGRLHMADAQLGLGNVLGAQSILLECAEAYSAYEGALYRSEVDSASSACRLRLGLEEEVGELVIGSYSDESADAGVVLRSTHQYASGALAEGATEEAIIAAALGRTCYPGFPAWGLHIDLLWAQQIVGNTPVEEFLAQLETLKDSGGELEQAAIRIQMAELLSGIGRAEEGLALLTEAEGISVDPRLWLAREVARAHCASPGDATAEVRVYEAALTERGLYPREAEYLLEHIKPFYWDREESPTYSEWLEANRTQLPDGLYRLHKAYCLVRDGAGADAGINLVEPILTGPSSLRGEAHVAKIVWLFDERRDVEAMAALAAFEETTPDVEAVATGLNQAVRELMYGYSKAALVVVDRILQLDTAKFQQEDAYLLKARILDNLERAEEAKGVLEQLGAGKPNVQVGEGLLHLADLQRFEFDDLEAARTIYEDLISGEPGYAAVWPHAYRTYAEMEEVSGNLEGALQLCEEGLAKIPAKDSWGRGWLQLTRARIRLRGPDPGGGLAELQELAASHPDAQLRSRAEFLLQREGE